MTGANHHREAEQPFTDAQAAFMTIGTTPALQGLRTELRIDGQRPLVGRYAGAGMRRHPQDASVLLIEPTLLFSYADADQAAELVVYRAGFAGHDIPLGLYRTAVAARMHCEAYARREQPDADLRWYPDTTEGDNEEAPEGLFRVIAGEESDTGYIVTPLTVASAYDEETDE